MTNFLTSFWDWITTVLKTPETTAEIKNNPIYATIDETIEEGITAKREPSKFAVIIGINIYDSSLNADLKGCVNDAVAMHDVLVNIYKFPSDNVRVLVDKRATKKNILSRIDWLLSHTVPGDELVLHFSGHGSQVRDRDGDELNDHLDEILCPTDLNWDDPLTDDIIRHNFNKKANGVFLTFICDSCHSGSMARSIKQEDRFISPPIDIQIRNNVDTPINRLNKEIKSYQEYVLLSGCKDNQTSADAYIEGKWQGAMTSYLINTIKSNSNKNWINIHEDITATLNTNGYTQEPQLTGDNTLIKSRNIFGS